MAAALARGGDPGDRGGSKLGAQGGSLLRAHFHLWASSTGAMPCGAWSDRGSAPRRASPGSSSSPGDGTTPDGMPCRRRIAPRVREGRNRNGASDGRRHARAGDGRSFGSRGRLTSTVGSGRGSGRRASGSGGCRATRCRSRRSSPRSRATRSGSRGSVRRWSGPACRWSSCSPLDFGKRTPSGTGSRDWVGRSAGRGAATRSSARARRRG